MKPLVSVIIPTYNREKFLPYALESVRAQTYKNWELIIIDDGSTDNTENICRNFAKNIDQPFKYFYQENQGVASARNYGLKVAKGDFIAFLDSDDRWYPWHLAKNLRAFEYNHDLNFVFSAERKINLQSNRIVYYHNFFINRKPHPILFVNFVKNGSFYFLKNDNLLRETVLEYGLPSGLQCMIFRTAAIKNYFFDDKLKIGEDREFIFKQLLLYGKCAFTLTVTVQRFVHGDHLSGENISDFEKLELVAENLIRCYRSLLPYTRSARERKIIIKHIYVFYRYYLLPSALKLKKYKKIFSSLLYSIFYRFLI